MRKRVGSAAPIRFLLRHESRDANFYTPDLDRGLGLILLGNIKASRG